MSNFETVINLKKQLQEEFRIAKCQFRDARPNDHGAPHNVCTHDDFEGNPLGWRCDMAKCPRLQVVA